MTLKTLDEHNAEVREAYAKHERMLREGRNTGIACPKCGAELVEPSPGLVLTSYPPKMNVKCKGCDYRGYAYR